MSRTAKQASSLNELPEENLSVDEMLENGDFVEVYRQEEEFDPDDSLSRQEFSVDEFENDIILFSYRLSKYSDSPDLEELYEDNVIAVPAADLTSRKGPFPPLNVGYNVEDDLYKVMLPEHGLFYVLE